MENLSSRKFRLGPRLHIDASHLLLMANAIGQYHSLSYALKIKNDIGHQQLVNEIYPISFLKDNGELEDLNYLYVVAFDRLFKCFDRTPEHFENNDKLRQDLNMLRTKYGSAPSRLLEGIRLCANKDDDEFYKIILHGDFYRNNVMFEYEQMDSYENPKSIKLFDFQDLRYSTPAFDLSYFMFMNMNEENYFELWDKVLHCYHNALINGVVQILQTTKSDPRLERLGYHNFVKHFKDYAIYGACIAMHVIPWMTAQEEDCLKFAELFVEDFKNQTFYDLGLRAGGDTANENIIAVMKHASRLGLFDNWY